MGLGARRRMHAVRVDHLLARVAMNQLETAVAIVNNIVSNRDVPSLTRLLDEAQNPPPNGAADGSIDAETYAHLRHYHDCLLSVHAARVLLLRHLGQTK